MNTPSVKVVRTSLLLAAVLVASIGCANRKKAEIGSGNFPLAGSTAVQNTDGSAGVGSAGVNGEGLQFDTDGNPIGISERGAGVGQEIGAQIPELPNVQFGFDQADMDENAMEMARKNAAYLRNNPELQVNLRGHTDDQGTEEYNLSLGQRRAQAVREFLIGEGIAADRLNTTTFGLAMPLATDGSEESRALNRRVEFFVY